MQLLFLSITDKGGTRVFGGPFSSNGLFQVPIRDSMDAKAAWLSQRPCIGATVDQAELLHDLWSQCSRDAQI